MENCPTKSIDETTVLLGTAKCDLSPLMYGHLIHECNVAINSEKIVFVSARGLLDYKLYVSNIQCYY